MVEWLPGILLSSAALVGAVLCLSGCSTATEVPGAKETFERVSEHQELMAKIEALVELPEGARELEEYGRNYAKDAQGRVIAVYNLPPQPRESKDRCSVYEDGVLRPCTADERAESQIQFDAEIEGQAAAGESRWFENPDDLPMYLDGGCSFVSVIYYPKIDSAQASCNGVA